MAVYVSHSTGFDFRDELYPAFPSGFILPHADGAGQYPFLEALRDGRIDAVLAEASFPSTGSGIEMGLARAAGVPVDCVHRAGVRPSGALAAVARRIVPYGGLDELRRIVRALHPQAFGDA